DLALGPPFPVGPPNQRSCAPSAPSLVVAGPRCGARDELAADAISLWQSTAEKERTSPTEPNVRSGKSAFCRCIQPRVNNRGSKSEPVAQEFEGHISLGGEGFRLDRSRPNRRRVPCAQRSRQRVERALHEHGRIRRSSAPHGDI